MRPGKMAIFSVYVVNKAGGLIYQLDNQSPRSESEKTFSFPLDLVLKVHDERVIVSFGQRDGIKVGHAVLSINGIDVNGRYTADGKEILEYLGNPSNYPLSIRFGRPRLTSNEKLMLASMFHSLFAIGSQLSPEPGSSGIEMLETDTFKLHCFQTLTGLVIKGEGKANKELISSCRHTFSCLNSALKSPHISPVQKIRSQTGRKNAELCKEGGGSRREQRTESCTSLAQELQTQQIFFLRSIKFMVLSDPRQAGIDTLLRKIYELYSDYALKNPFYSLEMPIR
ncbi:hypothetical protein XENTR_v10018754 [Xenopus tropicalis]|nr:hypothetical protein XENTR_v10018754 [Xenopus tropicalis]